MKTRSLYLALTAVLILQGQLAAQIQVTETRQLATPEEGMWGYARFSPDASSIFFSTLSYAGIWEYDLASEEMTELTRDEGSGYGFSISPDGKELAYRRTVRGARWIDRKQEIIVHSLADGSSNIITSARSVSTPAHTEGDVTFVIGRDLQPAPAKPSGVFLQGIVDQKIMLVVNGESRMVDPLGDGSYIWPALSPDRSFLVAYDMREGAIVSSIDGQVTAKLGRAEGPSWTRDGKWIVFFSESNDGYRITGGDIHAIASDGSDKTALTQTSDRVELFPSCSPTTNQIVCHTMDGKLILLTYSVAP